MRVDFPRGFAVLLALNFVPFVLLWKWPQVSDYIHRNRKRLLLALLIVCFLALAVSGVATWISIQESRSRDAWDELCRKNLEERNNAERQMRQYNNRLPSGFPLSPSPSPKQSGA